MQNILMDFIYCFIATYFFARIMNSPIKAIFHSCWIASVGYEIYLQCVQREAAILGFFLGTLVIALIGEILARRIGMPATIFIFPAVIPIVPGLGLYQTMLEFVQKDIFQALVTGANTLINIGAMAIAIAVVSAMMLKAPLGREETGEK